MHELVKDATGLDFNSFSSRSQAAEAMAAGVMTGRAA